MAGSVKGVHHPMFALLRSSAPYAGAHSEGNIAMYCNVQTPISRATQWGHPVACAFLQRRSTMLFTIAAVLIILWLLGLVSSVTVGGLIHVLLVIAIVVVLLRVISGRNPV
jgi:hypothetical protein